MAHGIRVLHVEDDPAFADLTATSLERMSDDPAVSVDVETGVEGGHERLETTTYDCIVSDYEMPETDGIEFLEAVREEYPDLPFVLFTGKGSEEIASEAISSGVTDYLEKESGITQFEVLLNRIENAVSQHEAERRAREASRRLDAILDNTTTPMYMKDADGAYVLANEGFREVFDPDGPLRGRTDEELFEPPVAETLGRNDNAVIEEGECVETEQRFRLDGEERVFLSSKVPIGGVTTGATDSPEALFGVSRDITERTRAAEERERRYEAIFNHTYQFTGLLDPDGTLLEANDASLEFAGLTADDVVGEPFWEAYWWQIDDETPRQLRRAVERAADGEFVRYEVDVQGASSEITIDFSIRPVTDEDGSVTFLIPEGRNISKLDSLRRRDRELARYEQMIEHSTDVVVVVDESGEINYKSPSFDRILGYDTDEPCESSALDYVHPDDVASVRTVIDPVVDGHRTRCDPHEYRVEHADGSWIWVESTLTDCTETPLDGYIVNARDITERKRRERELERKNERLEKLVSVVSHDLRSPLNVADGRLELARRDCTSEHFDEIARAHDRMETMIDELLTLGRSGGSVDDPEPVPVSETVTACRGSVELADASLDTDVDLTVEADRERLRRLLENLVRNAVEHAGRDVTIHVGELDDDTGFYVADDGPGIPPGERADVFESGYSTSDDGTGFGLSIVSEIAEAHGWRVDVTESGDGGARFEISGVEAVDPTR